IQLSSLGVQLSRGSEFMPNFQLVTPRRDMTDLEVPGHVCHRKKARLQHDHDRAHFRVNLAENVGDAGLTEAAFTGWPPLIQTTRHTATSPQLLPALRECGIMRPAILASEPLSYDCQKLEYPTQVTHVYGRYRSVECPRINDL